MDANEYARWADSLFYDSRKQRKSSVLNITIRDATGAEVTLPGVTVTSQTTLWSLMKHHYELLKAGNLEEAVIQQRPQVVNVEHIVHGSTEYIVLETKDGDIQVQKHSGEVLPPGQVLYNTVVKKYKERMGV